MISAINNNLSPLRQSIIAETKVFLNGLNAGASDTQLLAVAKRIRDKEHQLTREEGAILDPQMWRILYNRLKNRRTEFIDVNS